MWSRTGNHDFTRSKPIRNGHAALAVPAATARSHNATVQTGCIGLSRAYGSVVLLAVGRLGCQGSSQPAVLQLHTAISHEHRMSISPHGITGRTSICVLRK